MNVMILATSYLPHIGGLEQVVRGLGVDLQRRGNRVVVVTERRPIHLTSTELHDDLQIFRLPFVATGLSLHGSAIFPFVRSYSMMCLRQIVRRYAIDLIHLQGVSRNSLYGIMLSQAAGLPLIATHHGAEIEQVHAGLLPPHLDRWQRRCLEATASHAAAITTCSRDLGRKLVDLVPTASAKLTVVANATNPDDLGLPAIVTPAPDNGYLLGIGRLVAKKGFDTLLRALALLRARRGPGTPQLVLAGDGPERVALEALAAQLGVAELIHWEGAVQDRHKIGALYMGCRLCVVPSRQEPFGIVCLEVLAAGRPLVATAVGGIPDTVRDGIEGLLVPPDDPEALATAMSRILDGAVLLASPTALRARAEVFNWPAITDRYLEIYHTALATAV